MRKALIVSSLAIAVLGVSGCGTNSGNATEATGASPASDQTDPQGSGALGDQIVVDSSKLGTPDGGASGTLLRAPEPKKAPPPARGEPQGTRAQQKAAIEKSGCAAGFTQSADWAKRLPRDFPLYPDAANITASGSAANGCTLRQLRFTTRATPQQVIDFYYTRARKAGFSTEHLLDGGDHVLGGARERDNGAYHLAVRPAQQGGSEVELLVNNGL